LVGSLVAKEVEAWKEPRRRPGVCGWLAARRLVPCAARGQTKNREPDPAHGSWSALAALPPSATSRWAQISRSHLRHQARRVAGWASWCSSC